MPSVRLSGLPFAAGLVAAAGLVLAACSAGGAASPATPSGGPSTSASAAPATVDALDGRTFVSTAMTGGSLVEGSTVTLTFTGTRLGVHAGCNQMSGDYQLVDGVLKLGQVMTTEMACEAPLMAQDQAIAAFLPGAAATLASDTLALAKDAVTLTLLDTEVANPDRSLEGPRWVVTSIVAGDAVSSLPAGATASLTFGGGSVSVEAGCNTGSGSYTVTGDRIAFDLVGSTLKLCPDDVMALENAVLTTLRGEASYAIDADTLTLTNGSTGLVLTAQP